MKKMTGNQMLETAIKLLGYSDGNGSTQLMTRAKSRAVVLINLVISDLWCLCKNSELKTIKALSDEIPLPVRVINDVFPYGLAMFLAQSESDGDQQAFYARLYSQKRGSIARIETVKNVIPGVF